MIELEKAWQWRQKLGLFERGNALRVFHGQGESLSSTRLKNCAVDQFGEHFWITELEGSDREPDQSSIRSELVAFYSKKNPTSIVGLRRPQGGLAPVAETWMGTPPSGRFWVNEDDLRFWVQMEGGRQPGLFLDHVELRRWLRSYCKGMKVLNTFAFTGSLSVAAAKAGATAVTTLDLSKNFLQWAKDNFELNGLTLEPHRFIHGDYFEWLPRLAKEKKEFDCVILDPPSFSRGNKGNFSTSKDLVRLHENALEVLSSDGILITSINSANISSSKYEADILAAARKKKCRLIILKSIEQPSTFPTGIGQSLDRYLKGWIMKKV